MSDNHGGHHVTPISTYVKVAGALYVLTIATVSFHQLHLGAFAAPIAFLIASIKAALVLLWFMHLKEDNKTNRVIFGAGFFFLALLFAACALDIWTRVRFVNTL
jgi:cytochrome c oxidase subunit 4